MGTFRNITVQRGYLDEEEEKDLLSSGGTASIFKNIEQNHQRNLQQQATQAEAQAKIQVQQAAQISAQTGDRKGLFESYMNWSERTGQAIGKFLFDDPSSKEGKEDTLAIFEKNKQEKLAVGELPELTIVDKFKDIIGDSSQLLPFLSGGDEIIKYADLYESVKRLESNTETEDDLMKLSNYVDFINQDKTFGFKVLDVVSGILPFAGELLATRGIFTATRTATKKSVEAGLKKMFGDKTQELLKKKIVQFGVKSAAVIAGGTAQTPVAGGVDIIANTVRNVIDEFQLIEDEQKNIVGGLITGEGDDLGLAFVKAFGEQAVETISERTGGAFTGLTKPITNALIKRSFVASFLKKNANLNKTDGLKTFQKAIKDAGWNGVINEMLEERVGEVGHGLLASIGLGDQPYQLPSLEDVMVELVAFSIPGAGIAIAEKSLGGFVQEDTHKEVDFVPPDQKPPEGGVPPPEGGVPPPEGGEATIVPPEEKKPTGLTKKQDLENVIIEATQLGVKAFDSGLKAVPAQDPALNKLLEGLAVGQGGKVLKAWQDAWTKRNLGEEVKVPEINVPKEKKVKGEKTTKKEKVSEELTGKGELTGRTKETPEIRESLEKKAADASSVNSFRNSLTAEEFQSFGSKAELEQFFNKTITVKTKEKIGKELTGKKEGETAPPKAKKLVSIEDKKRRDEIKESITEGTNLLNAGLNAGGKKLSADERKAIEKSIQSAEKKLNISAKIPVGVPLSTYFVEEYFEQHGARGGASVERANFEEDNKFTAEFGVDSAFNRILVNKSGEIFVKEQDEVEGEFIFDTREAALEALSKVTDVSHLDGEGNFTVDESDEDIDRNLIVDEGDIIFDERSGSIKVVTSGNRDSLGDDNQEGFISIKDPSDTEKEGGFIGYANQVRQATKEEIEAYNADKKNKVKVDLSKVRPNEVHLEGAPKGHRVGFNIGEKPIVEGTPITPNKFIKTTVSEELTGKKPTQKEKVKIATKDEAKSIKDVSEITGILEPNVRRILGVGAKDGTFERVGEGVYILRDTERGDIAYIRTGDALKILPELVKKGFRADMVYLDYPYTTSGVRGGNRGIDFDTISPEQSKVFMETVKKVARTPDTPIVYMYSNSKTGKKDMQKYNDIILDSGLKLVAQGQYQKTYKDGKPMKFGKYLMPPEGIFIFNESGNEVGMPEAFKITAVAPLYKGHYQTEKAKKLLRILITSLTDKGQIVLDPFAGSGVASEQAVETGRRTVAIEKNKEAVEGRIKTRVEIAIRKQLRQEALSDDPAKILNKHFGKSSLSIVEQQEKAKGTTRAQFIDDVVAELGYDSIDDAQLALDNYKDSRRELNEGALGRLPAKKLNVKQVSRQATNSIQNSKTGVRSRSTDFFLENPQEIRSSPVEIRRIAEGDLVIVDGRHRLEAARQRGIEVKIKDVTAEFEPLADSVGDELLGRKFRGGDREYKEVQSRMNEREGTDLGRTKGDAVPELTPKNLDKSVDTPLGKKEVDKIIKRSDIANTISKKLNVPIRRGRFQIAKALGIFKPKQNIVRIRERGAGHTKDGGEMATIFHEVGHFIDFTLFNFGKEISIPERKSLLREYGSPSVAKNGGKRAMTEAFAEYLRFYMTQPKKAKEFAPEFHLFFEHKMSQMPEVHEVIIEARDNFKRWGDLPSVAKIISQISYGDKQKDSVGERVMQQTHHLYEQGVDDLHSIKRFVTEVEKILKSVGQKLDAVDNPYILARTLRGWAGKAETFLQRGTIKHKYWHRDGNGKVKMDLSGKSFKEILEPVEKAGAITELSAYLVSKRSVELSGRDIDTGISLEDAKAAVTALEDKYDYFPQVQKDLITYQDALLEYGFESGLYSARVLQAMKKLNKEYVPFYRIQEELKAKGHMGKGMANVRTPTKRIRGSEREIIDPLESIVKNTYTIINAAERNNAMLAFVRLSQRHPDIGKLFEKVQQSQSKVASVKVSDILDEALGRQNPFGKAGAKIDPRRAELEDIEEEIINIFRPSFFEKGNVVTVLVNGKPEVYEAPPDLYSSIQQLEHEEVAMMYKLLAIPAKFLRAGAVLSPEFMIRNPLRDQMTAYIYSKYGYNPLVDIVRGAFSLIKKDDAYMAWKLGGGEMATIVSMDREYLQKNVSEIISMQARAKNLIKNPLRILQLLTNFSEQVTRVGEARRALANGADPIEAAFASREVTLDFLRMGSKTRAFSMITAFFNPQVQGTDKMVRSWKDQPVKTLYRTMIGITLPSIILAILNQDEDGYHEIPAWQKNLFWLIHIGDHWYRIPKPFEMGILFGSVPERIVDYIYTNDPAVFDDMRKAVLDGLLPSALPTAIVPIIENITNHSFFLDRPIVGQSLEALPNEFQYTTNTSEAAILAGKITGFSPLKMENLIRGYTAGLGRYALDATDAILKGTGIVNPVTPPDPQPADLPVIRAFSVRDPIGSGSESVNRFYKARDAATKVKNRLNDIIEENDDEAVKQYILEHPEVALTSYYNSIARTISEIRNARNIVVENKELDGAQKRKAIDALDRLITNIAYGATHIKIEDILENE